MKNLIKKFIPLFLLNIYHYKLALIGAFLYGFPGFSKKIKVIGVTGTSGKSTTVDFICRILEEGGNKVASISSIRFKIGAKEWENKYKMTMPGRFVIQKFLNQARKAGCCYVVLEATSEGIRQFRHKFINFDTVVFTNLTPEHIESHGSFEKYRNEKLKLFKATRNIHIVNLDDDNAKYFLEVEAKEKWGYTMNSKQKIANNKKLFIVYCSPFFNNLEGLGFKIKNTNFHLKLLGNFNVYNALAAVCVGLSQGISLETAKRALEKIKEISGRMEIVVNKPFMVIIDYAHTPEQLESVYKTIKNQIQGAKDNIQNAKKMICVLGSCGGGRDKWKRPVLGKIAAQYCEEIIITNEDPYDEEPMEIINQLAKGAGDKARKILDRKEAIKEAVKLARPNDIVIITGKGSEPWMCVEKGRKIPWSDKKIVLEILENN